MELSTYFFHSFLYFATPLCTIWQGMTPLFAKLCLFHHFLLLSNKYSVFRLNQSFIRLKAKNQLAIQILFCKALKVQKNAGNLQKMSIAFFNCIADYIYYAVSVIIYVV